MKYKIIVSNFEKHHDTDEVGIFEEIEVEIVKEENVLKLKLEEEEVSDIKTLARVFNKILIDLKEKRVLNLNEIKEKWLEAKKKLIFEVEDYDRITEILKKSEYYENLEFLERLLLNYSVIPYLILIFSNDIKEFQLYKEFYADKICFDIEKKDVEEKKKIIGKIGKNFDIIEYKKSLREKLEIPAKDILNLDIYFEGEMLFNDEEIEAGNLKIEIIGKDIFNIKKELEIVK